MKPLAALLALLLAPVCLTAQTASPKPDSKGIAIVKRLPVLYTDAARDKKLEGRVEIKVAFDESGAFASSEIVCGDPLLGECAVASLKQWKIEPYIRDGQPSRVQVKLPFQFLLEYPASGAAELAPGLADDPRLTRVSLSMLAAKGSAMFVKKVQPQYPGDAKLARIQGAVVLGVLADESGKVREIGIVSGHPLLQKAALKAVSDWQFKPLTYNGRPVMMDL
jgi:TonB family protein